MEIAVPFDWGCINAVKAVTLPSTTPSTFAVAGAGGMLALYQYQPVDSAIVDGETQLEVPFTLNNFAKVSVGKTALRCMEVASLQHIPTAVASAEDGTIAFISLCTRAPSISEHTEFSPVVSNKFAVPASVAPTALAFSGPNELLLLGDAFGGLSVQSTREIAAFKPPMYAATLEGGSGPCIHAASFWAYNPSALLLAA